VKIITLLFLFFLFGATTISPQVDNSTMVSSPQLKDPCELSGLVYVETSSSFADYRVYVESVEGFADLWVYAENHPGFVRKPGHWQFTDARGLADFTIYLETQKGFADFSLFYTPISGLAGCPKR
jgi:hypothetical protein